MIRYRRNEDVVTRTIAGETVAVPVTGRMVDLESIHTLNEVGSLVWRLVGTGATVDAIVEAVAAEVRRLSPGRGRGRAGRRAA